MNSTKKTAVRLFFSLVFIPGSLSLCQAQCVLDPGAPAKDGGDSTIGIIDEGTPAVAASAIVLPETPTQDLSVAPQVVTPEPSTISLLLAGSAVLVRFGWRKRSN
jgi:hypothetical protein